MEGQGARERKLDAIRPVSAKNVREFFIGSVFWGKEGWFVASAPPALTKKQVKHDDIHPRPSSFVSVSHPSQQSTARSVRTTLHSREISAFLPKGGVLEQFDGVAWVWNLRASMHVGLHVSIFEELPFAAPITRPYGVVVSGRVCGEFQRVQRANQAINKTTTSCPQKYL
jgi:hypothetical protein